MNDMLKYAAKLRKAARAIEELFIERKKESRQTAFAITSHKPRFRKHWTQTVAGKRKMSKAQKAVWAKKKNAEKKAS